MNEEEYNINGSKIKISTPLDEWAKTVIKETVSIVMKEYAEEQDKITIKVDHLEAKFYILIAFLGGVGVLNIWSIFLR